MDFTKYLSVYRPKINQTIEKTLQNKLNSVKNDFLNDYYTELKKYFLAGGKRIRPLLTIATYNAFQDKKEDKIIHPSIGMEFLHNASLIHDDIIDRDEIRRGKPSFHYRFIEYHKNHKFKKIDPVEYGNSIGIIGGDSAFFIGLEAYLNNDFDADLNIDAVELYKKAFLEISDGVLIETNMVNKKDLDMDDYIQMVSLKTGALIEKSIMVGGVYAEISEESKKLLKTYGINIGILFQIIDDILGTFGDEKLTGKPTDGDIKEGKKTCLLIQALNTLQENKKAQLEQIYDKEMINNNDVKIVKQLFKDAEVESKSRNLADTYYQQAQESINKLSHKINENEKEFFDNLLKFVNERNF
ncbi:MAG: hypothetical protein GF317_20235 [Candidatus Lokiarchaeota archaeon]|nr:hypothetical protein [Candidatus Lokiarchaeota archaeon]MBD3201817.1 hypothetical protein [Candidatus Lokiarchaeota archaeon]